MVYCVHQMYDCDRSQCLYYVQSQGFHCTVIMAIDKGLMAWLVLDRQLGARVSSVKTCKPIIELLLQSLVGFSTF